MSVVPQICEHFLDIVRFSWANWWIFRSYLYNIVCICSILSLVGRNFIKFNKLLLLLLLLLLLNRHRWHRPRWLVDLQVLPRRAGRPHRVASTARAAAEADSAGGPGHPVPPRCLGQVVGTFGIKQSYGVGQYTYLHNFTYLYYF